MARTPRGKEPAERVKVVVNPKRVAKPKAASKPKGKAVTVDFAIPTENTATAVNTITAIRSWVDVANEQASAGTTFLHARVGGGAALATPAEIPAPVRDSVNTLMDEVSTSDKLEGSGSFVGNADVRYFWREDQLRDRQEVARELRELDQLLPEVVKGIAAVVSELRLATRPGGRLNNQRKKIEESSRRSLVK